MPILESHKSKIDEIQRNFNNPVNLVEYTGPHRWPIEISPCEDDGCGGVMFPGQNALIAERRGKATVIVAGIDGSICNRCSRGTLRNSVNAYAHMQLHKARTPRYGFSQQKIYISDDY